MKYLLISNRGLLDITLLKLIGASTKTEDSSKIGQFGTGLKYAISYLLRHENKFRMFIGEKEVKFSLRKAVAGKQEFQEIFCNGSSMRITTHYGYQWKAWEALRELWCNATDEKDPILKVLGDKVTCKAKKGHTRFYIEISPEIEEVLNNWESYFINRTPLHDDENIAIYTNPEKRLKIYKNGVLVEANTYYDSLFHYDFKNCELNELRQYQGYANSDIATALLNSNQEVIGRFLKMLNDSSVKSLIEKGNINFEYARYDSKKVKRLFQGYVFLHPDSQKESGPKLVKVPLSLYELLKKCNLPCEHIRQSSSGGSYGSYGRGYSEKPVSYKIVEDDRLSKRITKVMKSLDTEMPFKLAVTLKDKFEVICEKEELILNSELSVMNDTDLQAVIMIGLLHKKDSNMYNILKRLIKITLKMKNFKKILFG